MFELHADKYRSCCLDDSILVVENVLYIEPFEMLHSDEFLGNGYAMFGLQVMNRIANKCSDTHIRPLAAQAIRNIKELLFAKLRSAMSS